MPTLDHTYLAMFDTQMDEISSDVMGFVFAVFVMLFVALFDMSGVTFAIALRGKLFDKDNNRIPGLKQSFIGAGIGNIIGAVCGTSTVIVANESCAIVMDGGRTGLSACVAGLMFALSAFFAPIIEAIPSYVTAAPLVIVGLFMTSPVRDIHWDDLQEGLPVFLTVTIMPFTYSIANGVVAGLLSHFTLEGIMMLIKKTDSSDDQVIPEITMASDAQSPRNSSSKMQKKSHFHKCIFSVNFHFFCSKSVFL